MLIKPSRFTKIDSIFIDGVEYTGFKRKSWLKYYSELISYWFRSVVK